jgi:hypothetical protein
MRVKRLFLLALLGACGGRVAAEPDPEPVDAAPPIVVVDASAPEAAIPDARPEADVTPPPTPACEGFDDQGRGDSWIVSGPKTAEVRPLRCMARGVDTLSGRFVRNVHEGREGAQGTLLHEASRVYDYPFADTRVNHPALYWLFTEVALEHAALDKQARYPALSVFNGDYTVFFSHYAGDSITLGRFMLPEGKIDIHIAAHEYGHHVIFTLAPQIQSGTLHEGMADYFGCAVLPGVETLPAVPSFLVRACKNDRAWPSGKRTVKETCEGHVAGFQASGWDKLYPTEYQQISQGCAALSPTDGARVEGHQTGMMVAGALWSLQERIGRDELLKILLHALRNWPVSGDFGALRYALLNSDAIAFNGKYKAVIEAELSSRGMTSDVGLEQLEGWQAFPCFDSKDRPAVGPVFAIRPATWR